MNDISGGEFEIKKEPGSLLHVMPSLLTPNIHDAAMNLPPPPPVTIVSSHLMHGSVPNSNQAYITRNCANREEARGG